MAMIPCDVAEQAALGRDSLLTAWERARAASIAHARRRVEWIAGRVAAKWLQLDRVHTVPDESSRSAALEWPPALRRLGVGELDAFAPALYRRVELRRDDDGAPRLAWDGAALDGGRVSIAHGGGWALAAINPSGEVGVDLEEVAPRWPGFYETCLSAREREWMRGAPAADADRIGTLLWVLKESCLKTGASVARTVWEIGAIDLELATPADVVLARWPAVDGPGAARLAVLHTNVSLTRAPPSDDRAPARVHVAYGGVGRLVVGVVALVAPVAARTLTAPTCAGGDRKSVV